MFRHTGGSPPFCQAYEQALPEYRCHQVALRDSQSPLRRCALGVTKTIASPPRTVQLRTAAAPRPVLRMLGRTSADRRSRSGSFSHHSRICLALKIMTL